jgi:hypothetical protein
MIIDNRTQATVAGLLSWTNEKLNEFIYDSGIAYLVEIAPKYPQVVTQIAKSERFWNWWKGHWEVRDMEFIESVDECPEAIIDVEQMYKDIHDPKQLASGLYLNGKVLEQSYATLIGEITKEQIAA